MGQVSGLDDTSKPLSDGGFEPAFGTFIPEITSFVSHPMIMPQAAQTNEIPNQ